MAVQSIKNQYRGINAHLQSYLLEVGNWSSLHSNYIHDLTRAINTQLLPLGYTADVQQSLQIRHSDIDIPSFNQNFQPANLLAMSDGMPAELVLPMVNILPMIEEDQRFYKSAAIYQRLNQGEPVAWIELLSPSNKHDKTYRQKRYELLQSGLVYVEIDYLHDSVSTLAVLPRYHGKNSSDDAHPYRIIVFDPRPEIDAGQVYVHQFDVDSPIPTVTIPLSAQDKFVFDFNIPYQKTFDEMPYGDQVDYSQLPANFDQYSEADQLRILKRMLTVIETKQQGRDLEAAAPLPVAYPEITLEEAMEKVKVY